ncbi:hypothetical protein E2C01_005185 [Portunus trituberculatus]|uniref:Uncharacterized protein n=1 Tax=Portunus trituberculatus TaxID=210409 RepID=A0A5B7CVY6_PORTR|nr:hypothetical protein [Portunus trituberculatus]
MNICAAEHARWCRPARERVTVNNNRPRRGQVMVEVKRLPFAGSLLFPHVTPPCCSPLPIHRIPWTLPSSAHDYPRASCALSTRGGWNIPIVFKSMSQGGGIEGGREGVGGCTASVKRASVGGPLLDVISSGGNEIMILRSASLSRCRASLGKTRPPPIPRCIIHVFITSKRTITARGRNSSRAS